MPEFLADKLVSISMELWVMLKIKIHIKFMYFKTKNKNCAKSKIQWKAIYNYILNIGILHMSRWLRHE